MRTENLKFRSGLQDQVIDDWSITEVIQSTQQQIAVCFEYKEEASPDTAADCYVL